MSARTCCGDDCCTPAAANENDVENDVREKVREGYATIALAGATASGGGCCGASASFSPDALAHSVEALYATGHNPITTVLALEGVRAIHDSLPTVMASPADTR